MATETSRTKQLRKLAERLPGGNQKIAKGLQEARATQMQAAIGAAPAGVGGPQVAQQMGAQQAQQAGQVAQQAQQRTQQQAGQAAALGLQQKALESSQRLGEEQRATSALARKNAARLNTISQDAKNEMLDKNLTFAKDQAGQTLFNQRQLADWAASKARSVEEYKDYAQSAQQASQRNIQYLEVMHKRFSQILQQGYVAEGKRLDFETKREVLATKMKYEKRLRNARMKDAQNVGAWTAAGTIAGVALGTWLGGPFGGAAGGAMGAGAGTAIGSST